MVEFSGSFPKTLLSGTPAKRFDTSPRNSGTLLADGKREVPALKPREAFSRKKVAFRESSGFKKGSLGHDENG